jgi:hypothetical protein
MKLCNSCITVYKRYSLIFLLSLLGFTVCAYSQTETCAPDGDYGFVCGLRNAEDLVLVPGTDWIVASGMVQGASLTLIHARTKEKSALYPGDVPDNRQDRQRYASCPGAPDAANFITHGLNLRRGQGMHSTLYVVSHGAREAIEVFDVDTGGDRPVLTWTGCVPMPETLAANSVASFSDGSLAVTVLLHPGRTVTESIAGLPTGGVYIWSPGDQSFTLVAGSELPANNGIEVSADDKTIFVASSGLRTITAFPGGNPAQPLRSTARLGIIPDNVHRGPDGMLITAGMSADEPGCGGDFPPAEKFNLDEVAACPRGSVAYAIDPVTMEFREIARASASPLFSNATMALPVGDEIWFGTFSGDRVGYIKRK